MGRKALEKAGLVSGLPSGNRDHPAPVPEPGKPRTAPGTMMGFLTAQSATFEEAKRLKERVRELEGDSPLRRLDPKLVRPSKWANRHEASFSTAEFQELKAEIAAAGGNVQPIKVRPLLNGSTPVEGAEFELIFGHRRHRACLELGIPVLASIEESSDVSLFEQMERENRGRKNLSAWEQGTMYRRALDDALYPSLRRLAEGLGVDVSLVSKSVALARLPEAVVAAFPSPIEIQFRWASALAEAVQKDPDGTLGKAREIAAKGKERPGAAEVFVMLTESSPAATSKSRQPLEITRSGKKVGVLELDKQGRAVVRFAAGVVPDNKRKALAKVLEEFLKE